MQQQAGTKRKRKSLVMCLRKKTAKIMIVLGARQALFGGLSNGLQYAEKLEGQQDPGQGKPKAGVWQETKFTKV